MRKSTVLIQCMAAVFILLCVYTQPGEARKTTLRLKIDKKGKSSRPDTDMTEISDPDSLATVLKDSIRFSGFDKVARSRMESFFITNNSSINIKKFRLRIDYADMNGRMLHSRDITIETDLPSGETRKADIRSFDTQSSFYYHKSNPPRRRATPFKVSITPLRIIPENYQSLPPKRSTTVDKRISDLFYRS